MKRVILPGMAALLVAAVTVSSVSCKKKEESAAPSLPTVEQKAMIEEAKKGAAAAKEVFAARVNGVEITMYELVREMNRTAPKYIKGDEPAAPETTAQIKKEALNNLIFMELALQEAEKQGVTVSSSRIDDVMNQMKKQMGSPEAYQQYLDGVAITEEDLRRRIERSHKIEIITAKEIYEQVTIDEKDKLFEYETNRQAYVDSSGKQLSYEEALKPITRKLTALAGAKKLEVWKKDLIRKAKITIAKD